MTVRVESPRGPYDVHIGGQARKELPALIGDASRVAIIHSAPVAHLLPEIVERIGEDRSHLIEVPDAEKAKTPKTLAKCWKRLAAEGFTRSAIVIGIGGGTVTDLAGFVAASWLRGVAYVSIPTTVLGMVDAAVGGKTGINLPAGKNLVGAFHDPLGVICDLSLLASLPKPEIRSGMAEVIKCGFIHDPQILVLAADDLTDTLDVTSIRFAELVRRAVAVKAEVVAADLTERTSSGSQVGREALNYGHTLGHAIEAREGFSLRHGPAISIGMCFAAEVSRRLVGLDQELVGLHTELLGGLGLPTSYAADAWPELRSLMSLDKKARGDMLRLVGLKKQGEPVIIEDPEEISLQEAYGAVS